MNFTFYIALSSVFAHLGLAFFYSKLKTKNRFVRTSVLLNLIAAFLNGFAALMLSASSEGDAWLYFHFMRHFVFLLPPVFLVFCAFLAGYQIPKTLISVFIYTCASIALFNFTFFYKVNWLILELKKFSWGYFPVANGGAKVLLGLQVLVNIPLGIYFLIWPQKRLRFVREYRMLAILYVLWWVGILLNLFPFLGLKSLPLGFVADATFAVLISAHLHKYSFLRIRHKTWFNISGIFSSLAIGIFISGIGMEFLFPKSWLANGIVGIITSSLTLISYQAYFENRSKLVKLKSIFNLLRSEYNLTKTEASICDLLFQEQSRKSIKTLLQISDGTFRNHLSHIYEKTISITENLDLVQKDKLQRLTIFLNNLSN